MSTVVHRHPKKMLTQSITGKIIASWPHLHNLVIGFIGGFDDKAIVF